MRQKSYVIELCKFNDQLDGVHSDGFSRLSSRREAIDDGDLTVFWIDVMRKVYPVTEF